MSDKFTEDTAILKASLADLPTEWEGKASILALQAANYNWKQMEWWAFYFEHLCFARVRPAFQVPGERFGNVGFDLMRSVNWDIKAKAVKSDDHTAILNDKDAMQQSLARHGEHGAIIGLCDVEYNDVDRTFQQWHSELKGGLSRYETERKARTNVSRYRKTHAGLTEVLFLRFTPEDLDSLGTMKQGRNSNGNPRREKYTLDLEEIEPFLVDRLVFAPVDAQ